MVIQNVVVTGLLKVTRPFSVNGIVAEEINGITRQELSYLSGLSSGVQNQISNVNSSITTAQVEQSKWKSDIANAINEIPNPNNEGSLVSTAEKTSFVQHLTNVANNIKQADAVEDDVVAPKKFIDANGNILVGGLPEKGAYEYATSAAYGGTSLYARIPVGAYRKKTTIGCPEVVVTANMLATAIGLSADKLIVGKSIAGVSGTATSDATVTGAEMVEGKTAYVNGVKVTGSMVNYKGIPTHIEWTRLANNRFEVAVPAGYHDCYWAGNSYEYLEYSEVASRIGLTASKLVEGNTILGVNGAAVEAKEYHISDIADGFDGPEYDETYGYNLYCGSNNAKLIIPYDIWYALTRTTPARYIILHNDDWLYNFVRYAPGNYNREWVDTGKDLLFIGTSRYYYYCNSLAKSIDGSTNCELFAQIRALNTAAQTCYIMAYLRQSPYVTGFVYLNPTGTSFHVII